jgi:hypothetical protein
MSNFIEDCINGYALVDEIDDYIDQWHEGGTGIPLPEFLGMTQKEYTLFVQDEGYIPIIVTAHKTGENIVSLIQNEFALAARSDDALKSKQLQQWLDNEHLWD